MHAYVWALSLEQGRINGRQFCGRISAIMNVARRSTDRAFAHLQPAWWLGLETSEINGDKQKIGILSEQQHSIPRGTIDGDRATGRYTTGQDF